MAKVKKTATEKRISGEKTLKEDIRKGEAKFYFKNGDSYEGEYIVINNKEIYRHGYGVYRTSDQDEYLAMWDKDSISANLQITYSNRAKYDGEIDEKGAMGGKGIYIFPDDTTLSATWKDNEPVADYVYRDPLGYKWFGKLSFNEKEVVFWPENRIWKECLD